MSRLRFLMLGLVFRTPAAVACGLYLLAAAPAAALQAQAADTTVSKTESTWERCRIKAIPAAFLVDQHSQVVAQWTGTPVDIRAVEE